MRIATIVIVTLLIATVAQAASRSGSGTSFKIFEIRIDGKARRSLIKNPDVNDYIYDISRDRKRILFVRGGSTSLPYDLYFADVDGGNMKVIASNANLVSSPVFSPDGRKVAFVGSNDCIDVGRCYPAEVWVVNANGTGLRRFEMDGIAPSWSPDSRKLAYFGRFLPDGEVGVPTVANVTGPRRTRELGPLEYAQDGESKLSWSPRGDRLAYTAQVGNGGKVIRVARLNGRPGHSVRTLFAGAAPKWSPDGGRLAFNSSRPPTSVYVVGADGRHRRWLTAGGGPVWSPDGRWIAFHGGSRCGQLYVIRPNGRGRRQVTHEPCGAGLDVYWSPDSERLIYQRRL